MAKGVRARHCGHKNTPYSGANMVIMAEHSAFARSFDALFAEGMALADRVTAYFSAAAPRSGDRFMPAALAEFYERERKRLGAAALKMAAWLWVERALREGDISAAAAAREKKKLNFVSYQARRRVIGEKQAEAARAGQFAALPQEFQKLCAETERFIERIQMADKEIIRGGQSVFAAAAAHKGENSVNRQWQALSRAFGAKRS